MCTVGNVGPDGHTAQNRECVHKKEGGAGIVYKGVRGVKQFNASGGRT